MKKIIIGSVVILSGFMAMLTYSCLRISSKCSREEEKDGYK